MNHKIEIVVDEAMPNTPYKTTVLDKDGKPYSVEFFSEHSQVADVYKLLVEQAKSDMTGFIDGMSDKEVRQLLKDYAFYVTTCTNTNSNPYDLADYKEKEWGYTMGED